jgi:translation initiation factor 2 subunit 1
MQAAMRNAEALGTEDIDIKMKLVAPPLYVLTTQTLDKNRGLELLKEACDKCRETIESKKGKLVVKTEARIVSAQDDRLLNEQLEQLAAANAEVAGDADSDEEEEGMGDVDISGPGLTA